MVEAWAVSGLTQREFGRLHEVSVSSLNRWAMAVRRGTPMFRRGEAAPEAARVPIGAIKFREVGPTTPPVTGAGGVRIALPSGVELDIPIGTDLGYVQALVTALGGPC